MASCIQISRNLWEITVNRLNMHSSGIRESACVWAGERDQSVWKVTEPIFLNDLPGTQGWSRYHLTPREALDALFKILREKRLQIIADVHTHPGWWVGLSPVDREHPIEYRVGLLAIVLPNYARSPLNIDRIGMHEYLGKAQWRSLPLSEIHERLQIGG